MKKSRVLILAPFVLACLAVPIHVTHAAAQVLDPLEMDLQALSQIANGYPPQVKTSEERAKAEALWRSIEARLLERLKTAPGNFDVEMRLGDCYRMGHNLEIKGAWEKAVLHLTEAARIQTTSPLPPTLLGQHYAASGHPAEAEAQLLRALSLSGEKPSPLIHFYLAFTYYQMSQFEKVVPHSTEYLKIDPNSQLMKLLKDRAEASLRGEFKPKSIEIKTESKQPKENAVPEEPPPALKPPSRLLQRTGKLRFPVAEQRTRYPDE